MVALEVNIPRFDRPFGLVPINKLDLSVHLAHREDFEDQRALSLALKQTYLRAGYGDLPTEADPANPGLPFNLSATSLFNLRFASSDRGLSVSAGLAPTAFKYGEAYRKFLSSEDAQALTPENKLLISPNMANASILVPITVNGERFWLGHVKGQHVLGKGELHASLVAGALQESDLSPNGQTIVAGHDPVHAALRRLAPEKLGLQTSELTLTSARFVVDERSQGLINFGCLAKGVTLEQVWHGLESILNSRQTQDRQDLDGKSIDLEEFKRRAEIVISKLPIASLALIPVQADPAGKIDLEIFNLTATSIQVAHASVQSRPYTTALLTFARDPKNAQILDEWFS